MNNLIVVIFVVACVVVAWKRSAARAGHSKAWSRRIRAMGWGIVPLPIAIVAFWLLGSDSAPRSLRSAAPCRRRAG